MSDNQYTLDTGCVIIRRKTIPVYRAHMSIGVFDLGPDNDFIEMVFETPALRLSARLSDIKKLNLTTRHSRGGPMDGRLQYHWPLHMWNVLEGDPLWWKDIYIQYNKKLPGEMHAST